ncbi:uncharacterized protein [Mycetomoellerius zeteki]|uniref:uncharacterized protein isoform X2 n=1 Tax=Mycetomoellerius zeteki TaxID=64791 RepID=UPI00084E881A|nr:PREDICTED: uncharacterized protein LOC108729068 isoform X2 [Trachymyrmex zeteki]
MKQQWSISENNIELLEEGLYQGKQKCIKRIIYKTNCCTRFILYLKLIFLLEVILFFGWGCYMISQTYLPKVIENEATFITLEKYPSVIGSLSEIQESRPIAEMPAIFVKSEIIDKINNLLENTKFTKDQNLMQNEAIVTDATSMVQTNSQNSNNVRHDNIIEIYNVNRLLKTLSLGSLVHNEKFMKSSVPEKFSSIESTDEDISTYKKNNFLRHVQFLQKLPDISKIKAANDLEKFKSINDFTKDADYLILKSQENHALGASNNPESLEFNVAATSNLKNSVDNTIGYVDLILQDLKFFDLIKDAIQDNGNEDSTVSTLSDETNEQPVLEEEISKQVKNRSSDDVDKRNKDIRDTNDSDMSMSASAFENQDYLDTSMITTQSTGEQHSSEDIEKIIEIEIYDESMQSTMQDSAEFSTSNVDKFQWFNMAPRFADFEWKDVSKSDEVSSLFWDTYKEDIDDVIPESQCEVTIKMGILKVKCPTIKFDEEWNFTSSEIQPPTEILKVTDFRDIFDAFLHTQYNENANEQLKIENISNENFNKEVTTLQNNRPKIIDIIELQESTTNANDASIDLFDVAFIDPSDSGNSDENIAFYNFPFYDSNEEEGKRITREASTISKFDSSTVDSNKGQNLFFDISDTHQQEQLKINKEKDYSVSDNSKTFLEILKYFYHLEKNLTSLLKNEISNIIAGCLSKSSYENNFGNDICIFIRYMSSTPRYSWNKQFLEEALRTFLDYLQKLNHRLHIKEDSYRKKRMTDDLAWQEDEISNTLEEDNNDVDLLEKLKKVFHKMEILALCIDKLHERYLLHNKLDDDYVSSEFPIETEEHRESYTSRIVHEK